MLQANPFSTSAVDNRNRVRTALVASADRSFRNRLSDTLSGLRWKVTEAEGGAEAWAAAATQTPEAVIVDSWLPDLELAEFIREFKSSYPSVDILTTVNADEGEQTLTVRSPYRQELLYALRRTQDTDSAAWNTAPMLSQPFEALRTESSSQHGAANDSNSDNYQLPVLEVMSSTLTAHQMKGTEAMRQPEFVNLTDVVTDTQPAFQFAHAETAPLPTPVPLVDPGSVQLTKALNKLDEFIQTNHLNLDRGIALSERIPELVGVSQRMLEVSRRIRLVAARITPVLIEGPTGSGKELVAEALHRLSNRSRKPFVAINCAAIPESLLEAELFGHTRGAFTGAVQGRVGRIEAADGGTLFLDEIGEMPLGLQSKLLRFVESGELQRIGDNETVKVDVRILAATHQPLGEHAQSGNFRADLYYRLAVFLIRTPSLAEHIEDLPILVGHFLEKMGREHPVKRVDESALRRLMTHDWPGNVRELEHVLERAAILAGDATTVTEREIDFGLGML